MIHALRVGSRGGTRVVTLCPSAQKLTEVVYGQMHTSSVKLSSCRPQFRPYTSGTPCVFGGNPGHEDLRTQWGHPRGQFGSSLLTGLTLTLFASAHGTEPNGQSMWKRNIHPRLQNCPQPLGSAMDLTETGNVECSTADSPVTSSREPYWDVSLYTAPRQHECAVHAGRIPFRATGVCLALCKSIAGRGIVLRRGVSPSSVQQEYPTPMLKGLVKFSLSLPFVCRASKKVGIEADNRLVLVQCICGQLDEELLLLGGWKHSTMKHLKA